MFFNKFHIFIFLAFTHFMDVFIAWAIYYNCLELTNTSAHVQSHSDWINIWNFENGAEKYNFLTIYHEV